MTYAEKLAEFVKATGSKPGEMNKRRSAPCMSGWGCLLDADHSGDCESLDGKHYPKPQDVRRP